MIGGCPKCKMYERLLNEQSVRMKYFEDRLTELQRALIELTHPGATRRVIDKPQTKLPDLSKKKEDEEEFEMLPM